MSENNEIPMTSVVTAQPKTNDENGTEPEASSGPRLTGLGPLESSKQLRIKQRIRIKDVCGMYCCWDVSEIMILILLIYDFLSIF